MLPLQGYTTSKKCCLCFIAACSVMVIAIALLYFNKPYQIHVLISGAIAPLEDDAINKTGFVLALNSSDQSTAIAPLEDDAINKTGFVLALNSSDQSTGGAFNVMSLLCLMGHIGSGRVVIVEPFTVKGVWGAHLSGDQEELARENNVRLSDIYDIRKWDIASSSRSYARFVTWENFLQNAPRVLIFVDFHDWRNECFLPELMNRLDLFAKLFNFNIAKKVCFDFAKSGALNLENFKQQVYGTYSPSSVTVILNVFGGVLGSVDHYANRCILNFGKCSRPSMMGINNEYLDPSPRLLSDAHKYINKYLNHQTRYLTITLRLEYVIINHGITNAGKATTTCIEHLTQAFQKVKSVNVTNGVFFTMDSGKYGSIEFIYGKRGNTTFIDTKMRDFFHTIVGQTMTFSEWEESFQNISGLTSGGVGPYVAGLQKVVASHSRCIILAGGGSFQGTTLKLYKKDKNNKDLCFIRLDGNCNQVEAVLP